MDGAGLLPVAGAAAQDAARQVERPLGRLDDLQQGDLVRRAGQPVAALAARPGLGQQPQHLGGVAGRQGHAPGDLADLDVPALAAPPGQAEGGPDGVVAASCQAEVHAHEGTAGPDDRPAQRGSVTRIRVPSPGVLWISARPPRPSARSLRLRRPWPVPVAAAGSNPRPSSSISRTPPCSSRYSDTRQVTAWAWRLTLDRASRASWMTSAARPPRSAATAGSTSAMVTTPVRRWNSSTRPWIAWSSWRSARMPGRRPKM